jgi:hypothetical protein
MHTVTGTTRSVEQRRGCTIISSACCWCAVFLDLVLCAVDGQHRTPLQQTNSGGECTEPVAPSTASVYVRPRSSEFTACLRATSTLALATQTVSNQQPPSPPTGNATTASVARCGSSHLITTDPPDGRGGHPCHEFTTVQHTAVDLSSGLWGTGQALSHHAACMGFLSRWPLGASGRGNHNKLLLLAGPRELEIVASVSRAVK